jgi:hypothetical protein
VNWKKVKIFLVGMTKWFDFGLAKIGSLLYLCC